MLAVVQIGSIEVRLACGTAFSTRAGWAKAGVASTPAPAPAQPASDEVEAIVVYGQGQSRQVQTFTNEQLSLEAAGTSPLKAIEKLPGVSFQSADPFGAYEWSARISIRGFNQNQLGFTLDGVPNMASGGGGGPWS